jgi:hypothetical protein
MSNDHDLDPEIKRALDERIEWIEQVTGLARAENWPGGAGSDQRP